MSSRGVPGATAVAATLALAAVAGVVDVLTGPGLRTLFSAVFVAACVGSALLVRRRDLGTVAVMPPLVYVAVALVVGRFEGAQSSGSFLVRHAMDLFTALVLEAPTLLLASGVTLLVVLVRRAGARSRAAAHPRTGSRALA